MKRSFYAHQMEELCLLQNLRGGQQENRHDESDTPPSSFPPPVGDGSAENTTASSNTDSGATGASTRNTPQ